MEEYPDGYRVSMPQDYAMDSQTNRSSPSLSQRTLDILSFSSPDAASVGQWLKSLPKTDLEKSSRRILSALVELTQVDFSATQLLPLAELFRPAVYACIWQLNKSRLKGPVVFNDAQQRVYLLCQAMHNKLLCIYKVIVQSCIDAPTPGSPLAAALHRAMSESASIHLFSLEHYHPVPKRLWLEMHSLYQMAEELNLVDYQLDDSEVSKVKKLGISDQYKRALLLSHCGANQLQPKELRQVNKALSLWAPHSDILDSPGNSYLVTDLGSDSGLYYSAFAPGGSSPKLRGMDVRLLKAHLKKLSETASTDKPDALSLALIKHLSSAWGLPIKRKHQRQSKPGVCSISVGLSAAHYYLSDQQLFNDMVANHTDTHQAGKSNFSGDDAWYTAHDTLPTDGEQFSPNTDDIQFDTEDKNKSLYPCYDSVITNTSACGYCINIKGSLPDHLHIGEVITLRERQSSRWILAVIRWLQIQGNQSVSAGVEPLSAKTETSAIATISKTDDTTHFQRCFILPEVPGINSTATLIVPELLSKPGLKVLLLFGGKVRKGQLLKCVSSASHFNQFQFRLLDESL